MVLLPPYLLAGEGAAGQRAVEEEEEAEGAVAVTGVVGIVTEIGFAEGTAPRAVRSRPRPPPCPRPRPPR